MLKKISLYLLPTLFIVITSCSSDNTLEIDKDIDCSSIICLDNTTLVDCKCECKEGYFGENCDVLDKSFVQTYLNDGISPFKLLNSNIPIDSIYGKKFQSGYIFSLNSVSKVIKITMLQDANQKLNWPEAVEFCENYEINDFNDWYLPNLNELDDIRSILYAKLKLTGFQDDFYWSSETSDTDTNSAMAIFFLNGNVGPIEKARVNPVSYNYVRAVRSIQE